MAELIAAVSGIMNIMNAVTNVADGKQNGLKALTQIPSSFSGLMSSFN